LKSPFSLYFLSELKASREIVSATAGAAFMIVATLVVYPAEPERRNDDQAFGLRIAGCASRSLVSDGDQGQRGCSSLIIAIAEESIGDVGAALKIVELKLAEYSSRVLHGRGEVSTIARMGGKPSCRSPRSACHAAPAL